MNSTLNMTNHLLMDHSKINYEVIGGVSPDPVEGMRHEAMGDMNMDMGMKVNVY